MMAGTMTLPLSSLAADRQPFFRRHGLDIGLQLYTLGDAPRQDLDAALKAVAQIGYRTVEMSGFLDRTPASVATSLRRAGLRCTSVQLNPITDLDSLGAAAEAIGFEHVTTSLLKLPDGMQLRSGENMAQFLVRATVAMTTDDWKRSAAALNALGKGLKAKGLKFSYHNHNHEFAPRRDGPCGYDLLLAETDPSLVSFELDVGWAKAAGLTPAELLRSHGSRFKLLHLKDVAPGTAVNFAFQQTPADVGDGVQDWVEILRAAHDAGIHQFFVEREPPFTAPRLESARRSFEFLNRLQA